MRLIPIWDKDGAICAFAKVDDEDFDEINKIRWHMSSKGYAKYGMNCVYMHQLIIGGSPFEGLIVDHINRDVLDNQRSNLRFATRTENLANMGSKGGSSKYKGVGFHKASGKWAAQIQCEKVKYHLGVYSSEIEAAIAYNKKALELFGEYAKLNEIPKEVA